MTPGLKTGCRRLWAVALQRGRRALGEGVRLPQAGSAPTDGAGIPRGKTQLAPQPGTLRSFLLPPVLFLFKLS